MLTLTQTTTSSANLLDTSVISLRNSRVVIGFSWALVGTIDGKPLWLQESGTAILIDRHMPGIGFAGTIDNVYRANRTAFAPRANRISEQAYSILFGMQVVNFAGDLIYDPDITLSLLFDSSLPTTPSSSSTENLVSQDSATVGIAIGVSVAVVVVAGAGVSLQLSLRPV